MINQWKKLLPHSQSPEVVQKRIRVPRAAVESSRLVRTGGTRGIGNTL